MRVLMICPELPSSEKPGSMAPGARQIQSIQQAGIDTEIVDMRGIPKLKYLQVIPKIRSAARRVDLIHAHFGYCGWLALLGRKLARKRIPIVMSYMGDDLLGTPADETGKLERGSLVVAKRNRSLAKSYDQVIVKSREMAEVVAPVNCHVVPNGVDLNVFFPMDPGVACQQTGLSPTVPKVLFPGNPDNPRKGFGLATAAVKVAQRQMGTEIQLVPLWGITPDDVPAYMNACTAMLMTSLIEGSPNVVKEALACNQCVIGVPVGDVHEILEGINGCHRTSRDPEEIGSALAEVLKKNQRSNGREMIGSRGLSLESVAQRILSIYELALSTTHPSSLIPPP